MSRRELLERLRSALTDEERQIAELRGEGLGWEKVAEALGSTVSCGHLLPHAASNVSGRQLGLGD